MNFVLRSGIIFDNRFRKAISRCEKSTLGESYHANYHRCNNVRERIRSFFWRSFYREARTQSVYIKNVRHLNARHANESTSFEKMFWFNTATSILYRVLGSSRVTRFQLEKLSNESAHVIFLTK